MDINERLSEFYRRLKVAPAASNADEAFALVCQLIEQVEDELCPSPRENPPPFKFTGRMYAPQTDRVRRLTNGALIAYARQHCINCQPNGQISIHRLPSRKLEFFKEGKAP